ncbi:Gfo/Idh/MocA family oxidoreductase [Methylophilaceae bacterium]|nr:Gfo/Idh/MocA family oxidoreductase [Methylophilaceae bacterium]
MKKLLNVALVGCGRISKRHAELLGKNQITGMRLIAVCDLLKSKAKKIASEFTIPYYTDMHKMMHEQTVDVVVVLTESGNHSENVIALAPYGAHIIVEKPMALRVIDADQMIKACAAQNINLFVVKQNRFNVPVVKLREAIESKRLGKIVMGTVRVRWCREQSYYDQDSWRGTWLMDGGVLTNQASHHIDLLEWMIGDIDTVYAKSTTALVNIEAEDSAVVIVKFKNGALGIIEATTAVRPKDLEGSLSLIGEKGSVEISGFAVNELRHWNFIDPEPSDLLVKEKFSVNPPSVYGFGHKAYYDHVVDVINNKSKALVDGVEGRKSLAVISAIYEAIETNKEVHVNYKNLSRLGSK